MCIRVKLLSKKNENDKSKLKKFIYLLFVLGYILTQSMSFM
jgi:hypothetical protein